MFARIFDIRSEILVLNKIPIYLENHVNQQILIKLMGVISFLKSLVYKFDSFSTNQFLRFRSDSGYATLTGGVCSLVIIIVFSILFTNMLIQTVQKQLVTTTIEINKENEPALFEFTPGVDSGFMIGLNLNYLNLNGPQRYFDIVMNQQIFQNGAKTTAAEIPIQPCTAAHFSMSQGVLKEASRLNYTQWLCLPLNYTLTLQGKWTSPVASTITLKMLKCSNSTNSTRPCAPDSLIQSLQNMMGQFILQFMIVNPVINPSATNGPYLNYYLDDKNFIPFTTTLAGASRLYLSEFQIQTDQSLLPINQIKTESGVEIRDETLFALEVSNDILVMLYLLKSETTTIYSRSFNKIDNLFSYVGGLIGTILGAVFLMKNYTASSFQIEIIENLYKIEPIKDKSKKEDNLNTKNQEQKEFHMKPYNLLQYFRFAIFEIGNSLGLNFKWKAPMAYEKCQEEAKHQLDICFLLQRIQFLQRSMEMIFEKHQLSMLHMMRKLTIEEATEKRKHFQIKKKAGHFKKQGMHSAIIPQTQINQVLKTMESVENGRQLQPQSILSQSSYSESQSSQQKHQKNIEQLKNQWNKLKRQASESNPISKRILAEIEKDIQPLLLEENLNNNFQGNTRFNEVSMNQFKPMSFQDTLNDQ